MKAKTKQTREQAEVSETARIVEEMGYTSFEMMPRSVKPTFYAALAKALEARGF